MKVVEKSVGSWVRFLEVKTLKMAGAIAPPCRRKTWPSTPALLSSPATGSDTRTHAAEPQRPPAAHRLRHRAWRAATWPFHSAEYLVRSEERRVGKEWRSRWS